MYPDCIKISTAFTQNKGHLIDVKRLEENGKVLHTTLQYINSENKEIIYQRYFIKSIYTAEELISQSDDNRMTLKGYVVVLYIDNELEYAEQCVTLALLAAEEAKVAIRSIRRDGIDEAKTMQKNSEITEDDLKVEEDQIQKLTDAKIDEIDKILAEKEKEVMSI